MDSNVTRRIKSVQANYAVLDAFVPNVSTHRADRPVLLLDANLHDVQCLAVLRRSSRCCYRLLPVWLEKVSDRRCYGTLSLAFSKLL